MLLSEYVVFEANNKKVNSYNGQYVLGTLPTDGTCVDDLENIANIINEDDLVIVDGEWGTVDDVSIGDIITEVSATIGHYWMVNTNDTYDVFNVMYEDSSNGYEALFVCLNDEDYRITEDFIAFEGANNGSEVSHDKLMVKLSDNEYTGHEVTTYYNYLGIPVMIEFGDIDHNNVRRQGVYAVTSDGVWVEDEDDIFYISLVGQDNVELDYSTTSTVTIDEVGRHLTSNDKYRDKASFVWVEFEEDGETIKTMVELRDGLTSGDPACFLCKYDIVELQEEALLDGKKLGNTGYNVAASAYFFETTLYKNFNDIITGYETEVINKRDEFDGYWIPEGTLLAVDENGKIRYLFMSREEYNLARSEFYAVTSNGMWSEGQGEGRIWNVKLVGRDGAEDTYSTTTDVIIDEMDDNLTSNSGLYREKTSFIWAEHDDVGNIKTIVELRDGLTSGDPACYLGKYEIVELQEDAMIDGKKLGNTEYTVAASAYFYEATACRNDDGEITGYEVEVTNKRDEYDGYRMPKGTLMAIDENSKVKFFFICEEDSNIAWGRVSSINYTKMIVEIDGTNATKLGENSADGAAKGDLVGYRLNEAGDTVTVVTVIKPENFNDDDFMIVDGNVDDEDIEEGEIPLVGGGRYDKDAVGNQIKDYKIVVVTLKKDSDGKVSIKSANTLGECGFDELESRLANWDRFFVDDENETIFVLHGVFDKYAICIDGIIKKGILGDIDFDTQTTIIDVRLLLQSVVGAGNNPTWTLTDKRIMDIDGNDGIDVLDVRLLLQEILNPQGSEPDPTDEPVESEPATETEPAIVPAP